MSDEELDRLAISLEKQLMDFYQTPILTGRQLQTAMGYRSIAALRQSILRKQFPINVFTMPNRRGKFALVKDVARYLAIHANSKSN